MDQLLAQWKLWDEQIETLEIEIAKRQAQSTDRGVLATIPGCGATAAWRLACADRSDRAVPAAGQPGELLGPDAGCRNSGEATDRLGSITKQGSAMARFILGQLVLHVLRRDAWMRAGTARSSGGAERRSPAWR